MTQAEVTTDVPLSPRMTTMLSGQAAAEEQFLSAYNADRLHHAWLLTGPRGIGKATLAYRFARFLLAHPPGSGNSLFADTLPSVATSLDMASDHPVFHRVAAGGHADLMTIERAVDAKTGKERNEIVVDDVRKLSRFFNQTAGEGGWRIAIVDSADEMNRNAANALLKILEEPPKNAILLLVCHAPGRMLPTILSRCRKLNMFPLPDAEVAAILSYTFPDLSAHDRQRISALAHGSPGRAIRIAELDGLALYDQLLDLLGSLPKVQTQALYALADRLAGRDAQPAFILFGELLEDFISAAVQIAAGSSPGKVLDAEEESIFRGLARRISLDRWFELWEKTSQRMSGTTSVNLDRRQVVLNIFHMLETAIKS